MIYFIVTYAAFTVLLAFIESIRIKAVHGKVLNVKKVWSVAGAVAAFVLLVIIFKQWNLFIICIGLSCIGIRGVFYDPSLNIFLGRYLDQDGDTSNSKTDRAERKRKISFWMQRLLYLILAAAGYGLFIVSHLIFK